MIVKVDISDLDKNNEYWWDKLNEEQRLLFLEENKWSDIQWAQYKWDYLHTGLKGFINKVRENKKSI